jgi:hypothetical protein
MEGRGLVAVDVAQHKEAYGESGCELGSSVSDNVVRKSVVLEYMFQVQVGRFFCIGLGGCGTKVRHFGESVHADKDRITTP